MKALLTFFLGLFSFVIAIGQSSFFNAIQADGNSAAQVDIVVDFKNIIRHKNDEIYQKATMTISLEGQEEPVALEVKLKSRGNMRKEICYFPPLKLNLRKSELRALGLNADLDKYKLVLQCFGTDISEVYLEKEYLAYKIYETLTPYSFRVKPIQVNMYVEGEDEPTHTLIGLIIESEDELAQRENGRIIDRSRASFNLMDREARLTMAMYQYLIGNTDWYAGNLHNLQLLKVPEADRVIPLAYDFDYSGFVGTNYAVPHESIPIKSVRERYYMGVECTQEEYDAVAANFLEQREAITNLVNGFGLLEPKWRKSIIKYIDQFYKVFENPKRAMRTFKVSTD